MQKFKIKREWYSEHFKSFLQSKNRYQILWGGRGGGKTHNIILKLIAISFLQEYNHIVYVNKVFGDIRKNQFKDIIKVLKALGLTKYFSINKTNYGFKNLITGTEFTALGMDNAENTKGLSDPTIIWWDEINKGSQDDFTTLNALLRTPLNKNHQFIISFNPVDVNSWLRTYFFDENDDSKIKVDFLDSYVNHSTFANNEFIDREKYEETLRLNYSHNQNLLDVNLYGKWGQAEVDKPFIPTFRKEKHVQDCEYNNGTIYLSFDFNVNPMTCIAGQLQGNKILVIEEFVLRDSDIYELCDHIRMRLPKSNNIMVTGDATGKNRQAISKGGITYYQVIADKLKLSGYQFVIPSVNHSNLNSRELISRAFHTDLCFINPNCKLMINDLTYCEVGSDGKLLKKTTGTGSELSHLMDCLKYLLINNFKDKLDFN
jgi:phage terminase large subunit